MLALLIRLGTWQATWPLLGLRHYFELGRIDRGGRNWNMKGCGDEDDEVNVVMEIEGCKMTMRIGKRRANDGSRCARKLVVFGSLRCG